MIRIIASVLGFGGAARVAENQTRICGFPILGAESRVPAGLLVVLMGALYRPSSRLQVCGLGPGIFRVRITLYRTVSSTYR